MLLQYWLLYSSDISMSFSFSRQHDIYLGWPYKYLTLQKYSQEFFRLSPQMCTWPDSSAYCSYETAWTSWSSPTSETQSSYFSWLYHIHRLPDLSLSKLQKLFSLPSSKCTSILQAKGYYLTKIVCLLYHEGDPFLVKTKGIL